MSEIESVKPILTVVLDDGDFIINSTGDIGKAMVQTVLPMAAAARKVTIISDGLMRVMKRNPAAGNGVLAGAEQALLQRQAVANEKGQAQRRPASPLPPAADPGPDIQDQFAADLASGRVGEAAMGEQPSPTPGPNDPTPVPSTPPAPRRRPQIFQDAAAPPAPELAEAEMARLLAEAAQADQAAAQVAEDRRFQQQQAVQAGDQTVPTEAEAEAEAAAAPRTRTRPARSLATTGRPCGRCAGAGQIIGDAGFAGACPVCHGEGQVKTWDRSLKVR